MFDSCRGHPACHTKLVRCSTQVALRIPTSAAKTLHVWRLDGPAIGITLRAPEADECVRGSHLSKSDARPADASVRGLLGARFYPARRRHCVREFLRRGRVARVVALVARVAPDPCGLSPLVMAGVRIPVSHLLL